MNTIPTHIQSQPVPIKYANYSSKLGAKVRLFRRKIKTGYDVSIFQKKGNGIRTIQDRIGRMTDLSGLYVVSSATGKPLILGASKTVLRDIQSLARAIRMKDKMALGKVAQHFGFEGYKMGGELLLAATVNWIEVTDKSYRLMLKRAMIPHVKFVL
ncbi:hypothetical protein N7E81_17275 [Reichenbachiella carrageenanivorans]|uniref:NUMOD4 domain-containing protein n=1 Tax=Reichenbachiella carrageenanivorans TaxID=2979869 RepID=A0ABY6CYW0_9BACT|nr:hypothetical protein [Reichenbachiella carrageenanivorans]UXX79107.1 hypothetical protein N7E81_17275 [Reichenbachiella carrageenanivorans]